MFSHSVTRENLGGNPSGELFGSKFGDHLGRVDDRASKPCEDLKKEDHKNKLCETSSDGFWTDSSFGECGASEFCGGGTALYEDCGLRRRWRGDEASSSEGWAMLLLRHEGFLATAPDLQSWAAQNITYVVDLLKSTLTSNSQSFNTEGGINKAMGEERLKGHKVSRSSKVCVAANSISESKRNMSSKDSSIKSGSSSILPTTNDHCNPLLLDSNEGEEEIVLLNYKHRNPMIFDGKMCSCGAVLRSVCANQPKTLDKLSDASSSSMPFRVEGAKEGGQCPRVDMGTACARPNASFHHAPRKDLGFHWVSVQLARPLLVLMLGFCLLLCAGPSSGEVRFSSNIRNVTVTKGRDASLSCTVEDLGEHKVGWIHLKRQMIVAVHTRLITRISRFSVTHEDNTTWTLHIRDVREEDRGYYMCQVNTKPALSQVGFLRVVVSPTIVDANSSDSLIKAREKDNVTLRCTGSGHPEPRIMWRREDGQDIVPDDRNPVKQVDGDTLELSSVSRTHMGAYLCIASNGVPPSVSKRITLEVQFPPQIHVPNQLVGVPTGDNVTIDCHVEAFPQVISYWVRDKVMVMNDAKYKTETIKSKYKLDMRLTVYNFTKDDSRTYKCVAKNSLGETEGDIRLNEIFTPPKIHEIRSDGETNEVGVSGSAGALEDPHLLGGSRLSEGRPPVSEVEIHHPQQAPDLIREVNFYEDNSVRKTSFPRHGEFPFTSGASSLLPPFVSSLMTSLGCVWHSQQIRISCDGILVSAFLASFIASRIILAIEAWSQ